MVPRGPRPKRVPASRSPRRPGTDSGRPAGVPAADVDLDALLADAAVATAVTARGWGTGPTRAVAEAWRTFWSVEKGNPTKPAATWARILAKHIERPWLKPPDLPAERHPCTRCQQGITKRAGTLCDPCRLRAEDEAALPGALERAKKMQAGGHPLAAYLEAQRKLVGAA